MANTFTQILYHIVFSTKDRVPAIRRERREELYKYIWGIHKNLNCPLHRIGGVEDHVHLLITLHPQIALAEYVREIKTASTLWIRRDAVFADWAGWQDGYGAFTASADGRDALIEYIKTQDEHHRKLSFLDEFRTLLEKAGVRYDPKYLT